MDIQKTIPNYDYKLIKIPKKKSGEFRTICVPNNELKYRLREINFELQKESLKFGDEVQGFCPGKSPCSNATAHIGYNFTLSFDLKDFFDSVKPYMVDAKWSECFFINGRAYQGLPTSPAIANLAAIPMDKDILKWIEHYISTVLFCDNKEKVVYTRYADDLTFSFNYYETYIQLKTNIPLIVNSHGFEINPRKTHLQNSKFGRRIITGVAVDNEKIYAPREIKRKMRTARYNQQYRKYYGLAEWAKVKLPNKTPLILNSIIFNDLSEHNRVRNVIDKLDVKKNDGNTISIVNNPLPENYKFINNIQQIETQDLSKKKKKLAKENRIKNEVLSISEVKKELKMRSRFVFKEIIKNGQRNVYNIIRDNVLEKINREKNPKMIDEGNNSAIVVGNRSNNLAEELLS